MIKVTASSIGCKIIFDLDMDHSGMLNRDQKLEMVTRYLKGFKQMNSYFRTEECKLKLLYNDEWTVSEHNSMRESQSKGNGSEISSNRFNEDEISCKIDNNDDIFFSIADESDRPDKEEEEIHEIREPEVVKAGRELYL